MHAYRSALRAVQIQARFWAVGIGVGGLTPRQEVRPVLSRERSQGLERHGTAREDGGLPKSVRPARTQEEATPPRCADQAANCLLLTTAVDGAGGTVTVTVVGAGACGGALVVVAADAGVGEAGRLLLDCGSGEDDLVEGLLAVAGDQMVGAEDGLKAGDHEVALLDEVGAAFGDVGGLVTRHKAGEEGFKPAHGIDVGDLAELVGALALGDDADLSEAGGDGLLEAAGGLVARDDGGAVAEGLDEGDVGLGP
jgi:hypothetical protein